MHKNSLAIYANRQHPAARAGADQERPIRPPPLPAKPIMRMAEHNGDCPQVLESWAVDLLITAYRNRVFQWNQSHVGLHRSGDIVYRHDTRRRGQLLSVATAYGIIPVAAAMGLATTLFVRPAPAFPSLPRGELFRRHLAK